MKRIHIFKHQKKNFNIFFNLCIRFGLVLFFAGHISRNKGNSTRHGTKFHTGTESVHTTGRHHLNSSSFHHK